MSVDNPAPSAPRRGWLWGAASALGTALLLVAAFAFTDVERIRVGLQGLDPRWLAPALVLHVAQLLVLATRWTRVAASLGVELAWTLAATEYALSVALNLVLPTGMAGDALRAVRVARVDSDPGLLRVIESIALDRASGQLGLWLVLLAGLPFAPLVGVLDGQALLSLGGGAVFALGVLVWILSRAPDHWSSAAATRRFLRRATGLLFSPRRVLLHLPWSLVFTGLSVTQWYVAARAVGVELSLDAAIALAPWLILAASAPSFLGGWGTREGASALIFGVAGLDAARGVTVSVAYGFLGLVVSLPGLLALGCQPGRGSVRGTR
jgi:glycosyltransferase 2 family protein